MEPEDRFEWVLRRLPQEEWAQVLTRKQLADMAEGRSSGDPGLDAFFAEQEAQEAEHGR